MAGQNEAYNNPFNYQFVTNVFDQRFGTMPSLLQNIALGGCEAVAHNDLVRENNLLLRRVIQLLQQLQP